ncbi:MAG: aminopeptidase [Candidatus Methylomirabilota bacterium]
MQIAGIIDGARKVVRILARIKAGEKVLIVADTDTVTVAEALATAALEITPEVVTTVMVPVSVDGDEPPAIVAAALLAADVALVPVSYSISHSTATRNALKKGTRVLSLPAATPDQLVRGGAEADFEKASPTVRKMGELLTAASTAHLTTPGGTDCRFDLSGRSGNAHDCILDRPGKFSAFPNIEANISPVDGTAEGTIVFDGSIPNLRIGPLRVPVRCTVKQGSIVKVEGGPEADMIRKVWAEMGDAAVYNIAQLAIGLNPAIYMLTGVWAQDHGAFGTVHIGIGTSANLGGTTKAACHFDGMMYQPTLTLDGRVVLERGALRI